MRRQLVPLAPTLALAMALTCTAALAQTAQQRSCDFGLAMFPESSPQNVDFPVIIAARGPSARIRVEGSGEWVAERQRAANGTEIVTFDTGVAFETVTIGREGRALWEIDYRDPASAQGRVIAFAGTCEEWKNQ